MDSDREFVQSLERGLDVLQAFDERHTRMTLSEVAAQTDLTRATARRFLLTLVRLNLMATDGKLFWLTPRILDLGFKYLSGLPWWQTAQPIIEDVSRAIDESCSISVLDGTDIVYVSRAAVHRILSSNISIGSRFPAFCTAMGRALLSGMSDQEIDDFLSKAELTKFTPKTITNRAKLHQVILSCRSKGYAMSYQELEMNLLGLAVPIFDSFGRPAASLGASVHAGGESQATLIKRCLPQLLQGAQRITQGLRNQEFQPTGAMLPPKK